METRELGRSGIEVSAIGLGCMGMDHAYGKQADRDEMVILIRKAVELGCNFFDTAVIYGESNEELLGRALEPFRDEVVIATKFGIVGQKIVDGSPQNILDSTPKSIREQLEGSLKRLKVNYIDLYYQHRIDPNIEPEVVAETMKELIDEGKIREWGLSNAPIDYIKRAHTVCPISAIQNQYSMMWREPEKELFSICEELGISFVAYSPLGNGFLSGKYTKDTQYEEGDFRSFMGRFKSEVVDHNKALLDLIADVAEKKKATSAQIVLAWELAQKPFIIPIPGTTKLHRLEENLGGSKIVLTHKELDELNDALAKVDIDETHF
ncbi:aldo/keto reductase [Terribacillus saccharophilus]|uniref:Aldo/keto reductase n=1 Tax=Terribacillus saccharophilus TaxID=361277 RepID=A0ABX4H3M2_9BACI|nr:aldo/keto reductase [Terribacillus saccharophilus]PAD37115.1 aldo/keto reductase [Terribacillus saccharophilus]PAD97917.1 aldo/keto reductase [Terribacillus saccharophilus]PAE01685.1 aldo/keto reductase [Terribacillus saccharophilus]